MITQRKELQGKNKEEIMDFADIFADLQPLEDFDLKKDQIASHLSALLVYAGISRTQLAATLGWSKSRVTKALSGEENLTIKTINAIASALGYDFDIVYKGVNAACPPQPWNDFTEQFLARTGPLEMPRKAKLSDLLVEPLGLQDDYVSFMRDMMELHVEPAANQGVYDDTFTVAA
jgi:transcriptional regulator with XRE-family HTH domain